MGPMARRSPRRLDANAKCRLGYRPPSVGAPLQNEIKELSLRLKPKILSLARLESMHLMWNKHEITFNLTLYSNQILTTSNMQLTSLRSFQPLKAGKSSINRGYTSQMNSLYLSRNPFLFQPDIIIHCTVLLRHIITAVREHKPKLSQSIKTIVNTTFPSSNRLWFSNDAVVARLRASVYFNTAIETCISTLMQDMKRKGLTWGSPYLALCG